MKQINLTSEEIKAFKSIIDKPMYRTKQIEGILKKLNKQRIKTSSAKAKGRNLQKWVCEKLAALIGIKYDQSDDQCEIHSREMSQKGTDVVIRGRARKLLPLSIECKNTEKLSLNEAINQASINQEKGSAWVVVHKNKTLENPIVIIAWDFFEHLLYNEIEIRRKASE